MRQALLIVLAALAAACSNKLEGELTVNGEPMKPTACRSGAVYGFFGVELSDANHHVVRLLAKPDGSNDAIVLVGGAEAGPTTEHNCMQLRVGIQNSTINNVRNVEGEATISCEKVKGHVTFANCH
jgi:hypothetical protein